MALSFTHASKKGLLLLSLLFGGFTAFFHASSVRAGALSESNDPSLNWVAPIPDEGFYLVMSKETNELSVRSFKDPNVVLRRYRAISGTNAGDKEREGDKKTPEGIYFVERRVPVSRLQKLHGAAGFELNYPNPIDQIQKRSGSGIWIHGVDNESRMQKRFDTLGCVALGNKDVVDLGERLRMRQTPIVIVDKELTNTRIGLLPADGPLAQRIFGWAKAWSSKVAPDYLAYYSEDFQGRGMSYDAWVKYKTRLTKQYKWIQVEVRDLRILQHGKYAVAVFKQIYRSDRFQAVGTKRLYLVGEGSTAKILAEESLDTRQGLAGSFELEDGGGEGSLPVNAGQPAPIPETAGT